MARARDRGRERRGGLRRFTAILLAFQLASPFVAAPTLADPSVYGGEDWYASVYGLTAVPNVGGSGETPGGGVALSMGFRFNRWLAAETGGEYVYGPSYDRGTGVLTCNGTGGGSNFFTAWQMSAGGRLYLTNSLIQPYLLAHGGFIQTRDRGGGRSCTSNGLMARLGGGVEVFATESIAVSLLSAYVLPFTGNARDHEYVSVGLGITWY